MCDNVFCEDFKAKYPCRNGNWDHNFGTAGDKPLPGHEDDIRKRKCQDCRLVIYLDDAVPDGVCPFAFFRRASKRSM